MTPFPTRWRTLLWVMNVDDACDRLLRLNVPTDEALEAGGG